MSTSAKKKDPVRIYLWLTCFCALFALVYEYFSHGVYSLSMLLMFLVPLLLGALPCLIQSRRHQPMPGRLWHDGVIVLTLYCCLHGVLEIYGTDSPYESAYLYAGILLLAVQAALDFTIFRRRSA